MPELILHGRRIDTVFDLLGHDENDMTYALGWGLAQSASLLTEFVAHIDPFVEVSDPVISLQRHDPNDTGYTDIELISPQLHAIVEAKRGWWLPSPTQLRRYEARLAATNRQSQRVVVLTQNGAEDVVRHKLGTWSPPLPARPRVLGWSDVLKQARLAARRGPLHERRVARELATYLRGVADMRDTDSNRVYVVALSFTPWSGWGDVTPVDVVAHRRYFFPATGTSGWPKQPPNYIAFRHSGRLQSIHHVDDYTIADRPYPEVPGAPDVPWEVPHYILRLGPPIGPDHIVPTGRGIHRSNRVWVDIDLLFSSSSITDARLATATRRAE